MKFSSLLFIILFIGCSSIRAQQDAYHWRIGAHSGMMNYYGDLNQRFLAPNNETINNTFEALSYGISLEKSLSRSWSTKVLYTNGKFYANDRAIEWNGNADGNRSNYERSLNAQTDIQDLSLIFTYYFDNDKILGRRTFISPYLTLGVGVTDFQVFGDLYDDMGNRYHYWSDNTIRNEQENSASGVNAIIIKQDGKYETNLTVLKTEKAYSNRAFNIPFGAGLKFRISSRVNVNLDYTVRYAFTDYLDDVSGNYRNSYDNEIQAYASNPTNRDGKKRGNSEKNDFYSFASVSLHYNFGKKTDKYIAQKIYASPTSYQYPEKREFKIDSIESSVTLDSLTPAIETEPLFPQFNPLPASLRSFNESESEKVNGYEGIDEDMTPMATLPPTIGLAEFENKYRLQNDTIRQLEYEVKKLRLQNELYELRKNSPDASVKQKFREDSLRNSPLIPVDPRPNADTLKTNSIETDPSTSRTFMSDTLATKNKQSTSIEETASPDQLQRNSDASSLKNAPPETIIIDSEPTRSVGVQLPVQANLIAEETRPNADTLKTNSIETDPSSKIITSDTLAVQEKNIYSSERSAVQSVSTDTARFNKMQNEINDLKTTLKKTENEQNTTIKETASSDQLQKNTDASWLKNTPPETIIIASEPTPSVGIQVPGQANLDIINLERKIEALTDEVTNAHSNQTYQDSISLLYLENARKTEADLNREIDTLNSQLQATALTEDSIKLANVTAARDSLQNQVKQLQESLETLKSEKPDTVERNVVTIPELPKTEVFFKVNSAVLSDNDKKRMTDVANVIVKYPHVHVVIKGFTDKTGSADHNLTLSKKRAKAVEQVLILSNVPPNRITTESNGVDNELKKQASQYGRRVEIILSSSRVVKNE